MWVSLFSSTDHNATYLIETSARPYHSTTQYSTYSNHPRRDRGCGRLSTLWRAETEEKKKHDMKCEATTNELQPEPGNRGDLACHFNRGAFSSRRLITATAHHSHRCLGYLSFRCYTHMEVRQAPKAKAPTWECGKSAPKVPFPFR